MGDLVGYRVGSRVPRRVQHWDAVCRHWDAVSRETLQELGGSPCVAVAQEFVHLVVAPVVTDRDPDSAIILSGHGQVHLARAIRDHLGPMVIGVAQRARQQLAHTRLGMVE